MEHEVDTCEFRTNAPEKTAIYIEQTPVKHFFREIAEHLIKIEYADKGSALPMLKPTNIEVTPYMHCDTETEDELIDNIEEKDDGVKFVIASYVRFVDGTKVQALQNTIDTVAVGQGKEQTVKLLDNDTGELLDLDLEPYTHTIHLAGLIYSLEIAGEI